ncbi:Homeobox protein homothorax [Trachymyrmex cornetzi]|uniref:Homeobox protein homothorax n=1 Tax=Trachymyrmex cornetzi TaxID=471704 RepID=A0A151J9H6_9HYME|nr:Homeobox protein homothorax [Trachymyrmex cornetzi]
MRLYHMSRLVRLDGYDAGMIFHYEGNLRLIYDLLFVYCQRPPSSSLSYPGAGANDDARSPGSGGTPGPLSQQAPASLDSSDPDRRKLEKFGSNERTAPMVKTRPGSVSHRRVYKFTTSSHKDSLRRQEHDNPQLALSPSDDSDLGGVGIFQRSLDKVHPRLEIIALIRISLYKMNQTLDMQWVSESVFSQISIIGKRNRIGNR